MLIKGDEDESLLFIDEVINEEITSLRQMTSHDCCMNDLNSKGGKKKAPVTKWWLEREEKKNLGVRGGYQLFNITDKIIVLPLTLTEKFNKFWVMVGCLGY